MELNLEYVEQGLEHLKIVDHMLNVTYPLLKDPKMLLGVIENMHKSHESLITAVLEPLHKERLNSQSFIMQLKKFEDLIVSTYALEKPKLEVIKTVNDMIEKHKQTPLEFARKEQFIMCSPDYELQSINAPLLQKQLELTQEIYKKLLDSVAIEK